MTSYSKSLLLLLCCSPITASLVHGFLLPNAKHSLSGAVASSRFITSTFPTRSSIDVMKPRFAFAGGAEEDDGEFYPRDPASSTPQLLCALWFMIVQGCDMTKGESMTILFPQMESSFTPSYLERLMGHMDVCKDVCDDFGVNTILIPYTKKRMGRDVVEGFTVKSYKNPNKPGTLPSDGNFNFAPDPFWDDDEDWEIMEQALREEEEEDALDSPQGDELPEIVDRIPTDDDQIIETTKTWVGKMMSDMGICPFTSGAEMAGLPMGKVFYTTDRSTKMEDMYARYWKEVVRVEQNTEKDLSTTLLIAPEFCIDNVELFENFSNSLTHPLEPLQIEELLQLVFFHPEWTFRDGGERSGIGAAANYARRSPWPMINILRTKQVRAAQRGIPTGLVYQQNEKTLNSIGTKSLETMLRLRDWKDLEGLEVDRKDMEALRVAQDFQSTGVVTEKDTSMAFDSTPAANKVDPNQIEGGNMVNVVMQALEKRLHGGENGGVQKLTGAETSAAMMASDFLDKHLEELGNSSGLEKSGVKSKQMLFDEEDSSGDDDDEISALFGGGGIKMTSEDDEDFTGADPRNFY